MIKKDLTLSRQDFFSKHLEIVRCFLPRGITDVEIKVLSAFMSLEGEVEKYPFSTIGRKEVKEKLGMTDGNLGNHLKSLKKKGLIKDNLGILSLHPALLVKGPEQEYSFKLKIG